LVPVAITIFSALTLRTRAHPRSWNLDGVRVGEGARLPASTATRLRDNWLRDHIVFSPADPHAACAPRPGQRS